MTVTASTEITEADTRATRLAVLESQVCEARDALRAADLCEDLTLALAAAGKALQLNHHHVEEPELPWDVTASGLSAKGDAAGVSLGDRTLRGSGCTGSSSSAAGRSPPR
jgi:hypothetical protein